MTKAPTPSYLLVSHGSRDPRSQAMMKRLAHLVQQRLGWLAIAQQAYSATAEPALALSAAAAKPLASNWQPSQSSEIVTTGRLRRQRAAQITQVPLVETACLELGPTALRTQVCQFAQKTQAAGKAEMRIVPLFLLQGVHVMEDLPAEVAAARQQMTEAVSLTLCPHLGSHSGLTHLLSEKAGQTASRAFLLVAHGSRRAGSNKQVEAIAKQMGATVAYWSTPPSLEAQVVDLMQQGYQRIVILPYFLFAGTLIDAIMQRTEELAERFPKVAFRLLPPLGATRELAGLVADLASRPFEI
ncbi:sirohydrochlorin chelatase [Sphaerothrix gracilis]|uniref:sirohydrochlorin chelatase n=1 Tax=Sphaerothrix gracilis TaxID=3151835 RepID=UPI0031FC83CD